MTLQKSCWVAVDRSKYHLQYIRLESWLCDNTTLLKPSSFESATVLWLLFAKTRLYLKYPIKCQFDSHQLSTHKERNNAASLPVIIVYNFSTTTTLAFLRHAEFCTAPLPRKIQILLFQHPNTNNALHVLWNYGLLGWTCCGIDIYPGQPRAATVTLQKDSGHIVCLCVHCCDE